MTQLAFRYSYEYRLRVFLDHPSRLEGLVSRAAWFAGASLSALGISVATAVVIPSTFSFTLKHYCYRSSSYYLAQEAGLELTKRHLDLIVSAL